MRKRGATIALIGVMATIPFVTACHNGKSDTVASASNASLPGIYDSLEKAKASIHVREESVDSAVIDELFDARSQSVNVGSLQLEKDVEVKQQTDFSSSSSNVGTTPSSGVDHGIEVSEEGVYKVSPVKDLKPYVDLSQNSLTQNEFDLMKAVAIELYTRQLNSKLKEDRYIAVESNWEPGELESLESPLLYEINDGELSLRMKVEVYDKEKDEKKVEIKTFVIFYEGDVAVLR